MNIGLTSLMLIIIILGWFESFRARLRPPFHPQERYSAHGYGSYRDCSRQKSAAMSYVSQHTLLVSDGIVEVGLHLHIFWAKPWFIGRRGLLKPILTLEFLPFVRWFRLRHELDHAFSHRLTLLLQLRIALSAARGIQVDLQKLKLLWWVEEKVESEQFKAPLLVPYLSAAQHSFQNDVVRLLSVLHSEVAKGIPEEVLEHQHW